MSTSRAFRQTFAAAVVIGVVDWMLPLAVAQKTYYAGALTGYVLLMVFGFLAIREGKRLREIFAYTWPFVFFWFALGLLNFALGRGEVPADWSPELDRLAFKGYIMASVMFLPLAFALSALGASVASLSTKLRRSSGMP